MLMDDIEDVIMEADYVQIHEFSIPRHSFDGIVDYVDNKVPPGDFLYAVLTNDLSEACGRADHINSKALVDIVSFIYNYAPSQCWGSEDKVKQWLQGGK